ncbi:G-protein coupled receptor GRL101-like [Planococcus citri]|uniref:G-protein coupled receptor GRL101-like n=1 Tax=Planococcus citri TaxID=170843 RepID=UPI0031F78F67
MQYLSLRRSLTIDLFLLLVFYQYNELCVVNSTSNYSTTSIEEIRKFPCNISKDEEVFHCDDSNCIRLKNRCDNVRDCDNGEDESVQNCGCLPNEFRCSNSCIDLLSRCDRNTDCPNGEDEENCGTYQCPTTHFKCENDFCIPIELTCNFVDDCGDNSDEYTECSHRKCYFPEFRCQSGQCIRPAYLCDNQSHCHDNSDEEECSPENFVECGDGSLVHKNYWCDNWTDCPDNHADELNCGECTGDDKFQCSNGRCIRQANVCDAYCDCVDQSSGDNKASNSTCEDEQDCEEFYTFEQAIKTCRVGISINCIRKFSTHDTRKVKYRCIRGEYICDGENDCQNGNPSSDEYGCNVTDPEADKYFRCEDGRFLPSNVRCNHEIDCLSGEDEDNCTFTSDVACVEGEYHCKNQECLNKNFFCNGIFDCSDRSDETRCHDLECPHGFQRCVHGGQCFKISQWCDYHVDCPDGSDEEDCPIENCTESQFQCRNGQCIDKFEECVNTGFPKSGCADGSHLTTCENKVCEKGFYKCYRGPCINESLICNGKIDCKGAWDDENNCPFECAESMPACECRDKHINCTNLSLTYVPNNIEKEITWFHLGGNELYHVLTNETFYHFNRLLYLDLSNNNITMLIPYMFEKLWRLNTLNLQNNNIEVLENGTFYGLSKLKGLHLEGNKIRVLKSMAFYGLSSLKTLSLQNQRIEYIQNGSFVGLKRLTTLNLAHNRITILRDENDVFIGMPSLIHLDLRNNPIISIEAHVFKVTNNLNYLFLDEFRFCCVAKHVEFCYPPPDEFSSCEDLMSNILLRICIWILGIIATFANLLVIVFRTLYKNTNKVHSFLIKNLALGDLLMGIYLLIIAYVDWYFRGMYFIFDSQWRSSAWCSFAGFISTFSSELSVFTLTVITLDRFLVIIFPFRTHRLEINRTRFLMTLGWVLAALISIIPLPFLRIEYFHNFYGRSGVCLPLHITPDKPSGWEYSVFVFLFLNFLSFMIIAGSYLWMYLAARNTHRAVQRESRTSDSAMAFRMTLLVATDAACWFPIILLGLLSLAGFTVPPQVFAWVAVFVLPLNAALNPILYTLSTAPFMNPTRTNLITLKRTLSRNDRRSYYTSTALHYNNTHECVTAEEFCSEPSTLNCRSWRTVDTIVREHGETMPLKQTKLCVQD